MPGDIRGPVAPAAFAGCEAILHVAGRTNARSLEDYRAANAFGVENVARGASASAPGARFVLVSSQAAAGPSRDGRPVREEDSPRPVSWYGRSKLEGERILEGLWKGSWTIVRPSIVYGEGDPGMLQLFATVARGWAPILAGGRSRVQLIAAGDLARALVAAADGPRLEKRRGFAAGPAVGMGELVLYAASLRRPPARRLPIPGWAVRAAGWVETLREKATGRTRPFNRDKATEILQRDWLCDPEPFLRDADVVDLVAWKQGIAETIAWYQRAGWLAPAFGEL